MLSSRGNNIPLISVIIPCYNHGHHLRKAIESALNQTYPLVELVVVNDGSMDHTADVAASYSQVKYVYQANQGLSSARNTGVAQSSGEFLIFLDADDWLYPEALEINASYLLNDEKLAFVSGAYDMVLNEENEVKEFSEEISSGHYLKLLEGNFIAVPASVMYRRWVFEEFLFDVGLKACEDYDLYLKVSRKYPIHQHTEKIAAYQKHSANMSANAPLMLGTALDVLERQKNQLTSDSEKQSYKKGRCFWKEVYCNEIYIKLLMGHVPATKLNVFTLLRYRPLLFMKFVIHKWRQHFLLKLAFNKYE